MPDPSPVTLELLNERGEGLSVRFDRRGDRFGHALVLVQQAHETLLAKSVEGIDVEPWPVSPALQSQYADSTRGPARVLLVGMSGRSHWSLSVEADAAAGVMLFDVACRVNDLPPRLGCKYEAPQPKAGWVFKGGLHLGEESLCQLETWPTGQHRPPMFSLTQSVLEVVPREFDTTPAQLDLPTTIRWAYRLRWIGPPGTFTASIVT